MYGQTKIPDPIDSESCSGSIENPYTLSRLQCLCLNIVIGMTNLVIKPFCHSTILK